MKVARDKAPRPYFVGALIGYLIAIIVTVVVMLVFETVELLEKKTVFPMAGK